MARDFNYEGLTETIPVREAHRINVDVLSEYLRATLDGMSDSLEVVQMRAGQSNPTYLLTSGDVEWVLRKKPPGELLPSAHAVEREYRVQKALYAADVPVAQMLHLCEDPEIIGTPFYVMERMKGRVFHVNSIPDVTREERRLIFSSMNDILARIHSVDWKKHGLESFGKPGNYYTRQVGRWGKQWGLSKQAEIVEMEKIIAWLNDNIPPDDETTLVHGDYRLGNMMFHPTKPEAIAVFDWELSTLGHPLGDLAYNLLPYYNEPHEFNGIKGLDHEELGIPQLTQYSDEYCQRTGRAKFDLTFYMVFSLFRSAAIAEGIAARAASGIASSEHATEVGAMTRSYAQKAWGLVESEGLA